MLLPSGRVPGDGSDLTHDQEGSGAGRQGQLFLRPHLHRFQRLAGERIVGGELQGGSRLERQTVRPDANRHADEMIALSTPGISHASIPGGIDFGPTAVAM